MLVTFLDRSVQPRPLPPTGRSPGHLCFSLSLQVHIGVTDIIIPSLSTLFLSLSLPLKHTKNFNYNLFKRMSVHKHQILISVNDFR